MKYLTGLHSHVTEAVGQTQPTSLDNVYHADKLNLKFGLLEDEVKGKMSSCVEQSKNTGDAARLTSNQLATVMSSVRSIATTLTCRDDRLERLDVALSPRVLVASTWRRCQIVWPGLPRCQPL